MTNDSSSADDSQQIPSGDYGADFEPGVEQAPEIEEGEVASFIDQIETLNFEGPIIQEQIHEGLVGLQESLERYDLEPGLLGLISSIEYIPTQGESPNPDARRDEDREGWTLLADCNTLTGKLRLYPVAAEYSMNPYLNHEFGHLLDRYAMTLDAREKYLQVRKSLLEQSKITNTDYVESFIDARVQSQEAIADDIMFLLSDMAINPEHKAALLEALHSRSAETALKVAFQMRGQIPSITKEQIESNIIYDTISMHPDFHRKEPEIKMEGPRRKDASGNDFDSEFKRMIEKSQEKGKKRFRRAQRGPRTQTRKQQYKKQK